MSDRKHLLDLGYRMLGSLVEAEDAVQDAYARWFALPDEDRERIENPSAWLTTVTSRICLDQLRSARVRRETYVGQWLPEPLPEPATGLGSGPGADPAERITLDESITMALMVVMESMTPAERVSFVLHDVFGYRFAEVAAIVGRSAAACRQLASSARARVRRSRPIPPTDGRQAGVIRRFKSAWEAKDIDALVSLLDPGVVASADSGGKAVTFAEPVEGRDDVARVWMEIAERAGAVTRILERTVNGQPGLIAIQDGIVVTTFAFEVTGDRITRIWAVRNPDKLRAWIG